MIRLYLLAVVAVLALSVEGCAAGVELPSNVEMLDAVEEPTFVGEELRTAGTFTPPAESLVFETFSPSPEALPYVEHALEIWSAATGRVLEIGEGGVRVELAPQVFLLDDHKHDHEVCARTEIYWNIPTGLFVRTSAVEVAAAPGIACPSIQCAINHEIGHAIACPNYGDEMHAEDGAVMAPALPAEESCPLPDARDLAVVCNRAPCD